jgi:ABC-2 type transport system ATP-binding protein
MTDPGSLTDRGSPTDPVIETRGLTRRFGALTAVESVDLAVPAGQVYAFLGRNGAGKTTVIRMLLGLIPPTSGEVRLLGVPVRGGSTAARLWAGVGFLVEGPGLYGDLTVAEHLMVAARYRGLSVVAVDAVVERLELGRYLRVRAEALSLGNRQRLGLALALVHRPALVILDEPVNGLDPAGVVDVRHLLRELADEGVTVFMSTHLVAEAARLADRVGIIHAGRLVRELPGDRLGAEGGQRVVAEFRTPELARRAASALGGYGLPARAQGTTVEARTPEAVHSPETVVTRLVEAGTAPISLAVEREDLEELFLRLTEVSADPSHRPAA